MYEVLIILILGSTLCAINGTFLVLRGISMIADAISHSVLLGIVLTFFIVRDVGSPLLMVGAALFGLITVYSVEKISTKLKVHKDDAIGIVYTIFFALAIVLISKFIRNAHIDTEIVLLGEILFQPLNRMDILGISLPVKTVHMSILLIINIIILALFYREVKIATFDEEYAKLSGVKIKIIFYTLMFITSINAVASFDAIGAILVISFMIAPAASSYLLTKDLKNTLLVAVLYGVINSLIGYVFALQYNVSMAGSAALAGLLTFLLTVVFYKGGIITTAILRRKKLQNLYSTVILMHIYNHYKDEDRFIELGRESISKHLGWTNTETEKRIKTLLDSGDVKLDDKNNYYTLTESGLKRTEKLRTEYNY